MNPITYTQYNDVAFKESESCGFCGWLCVIDATLNFKRKAILSLTADSIHPLWLVPFVVNRNSLKLVSIVLKTIFLFIFCICERERPIVANS